MILLLGYGALLLLHVSGLLLVDGGIYDLGFHPRGSPLQFSGLYRDGPFGLSYALGWMIM